MELVGVFSGPDMHYIYPHGDEVYVVDVIFACTRFDGTVTINEESRQYGFFAVDHLPPNISPPARPIAQEVVRRYGTAALQESAG